MIADPIVDEVRAVRDSIASAHEYSIEAIFRTLRELESERLADADVGELHPDQEVGVPKSR
jgi:hypothetical protein